MFPAGHSLSVMVQLTKSNHRNRSCSTGANHFPSAQQHLCFPLCACRLNRLSDADACRSEVPTAMGGPVLRDPAKSCRARVEIESRTGFWQPGAASVRLLRSRPAREIAALIITSAARALPPRLLIIADFAIICSSGRVGLIIRFLSIGPRTFSTPPSNPAWRRRPCASLTLRHHQSGWMEDLHLQATDHARYTNNRPHKAGDCGGRPSADWADWPPRFA